VGRLGSVVRVSASNLAPETSKETYSMLHNRVNVSFCRPGCNLLLQDRRGAGSCRYTGRSTGRHHDVSGPRYSTHGQEERDRA